MDELIVVEIHSGGNGVIWEMARVDTVLLGIWVFLGVVKVHSWGGID